MHNALLASSSHINISSSVQITASCLTYVPPDAAACTLQDLNITIDSPDVPQRVISLIQQWTQALLWGLDNLQALMICGDTAPCPPVLGCLPKLRYLELTLWQPEAWLEHFFVDLSFCSCLESLKVCQPDLEFDDGSWKLPEVQLSALPKLKRIELRGYFPDTDFHLPPDCELRLSVVCGKECDWEEGWRAMQGHLTVLTLGDLGLQEWPAGLEQVSRLQYFRLECENFLGQDLAVLKAIPHVSLFIDGTAGLVLTDGAWQSLEVYSTGSLTIDFANADAFVRGTERFLFSANMQMSQALCALIRGACSRQSKSCYQSMGRSIVRLSNCEDVMRLEPSRDGTPSGGLHDGYAGTPENSRLWEQLSSKHLVSEEQYWPTWEPHKWVFGE